MTDHSFKSGQHDSKFGHIQETSFNASLDIFKPDDYSVPLVPLAVKVNDLNPDVPMHKHKRGQLVCTLKGVMTCNVAEAIWLVPPDCALWIPGDTLHRSIVDPESIICFLYIRPDSVSLPETCCTVSLTPLMRELVSHIAGFSPEYQQDSREGRIIDVFLENLELMEVEELRIPLPDNPRLRKIAQMLLREPGDRHTLEEWANEVALSERSLRRLVQAETGMTFGQWRQQFQLMVAIQELSAGATVQSVSDKLGYESVSAFTTMFKKVMGSPPKTYSTKRLDSK